MGLPEPPDPETNLSATSDHIVAVESDTEEEDNAYDGYERLPMNAEDDGVEASDEESEPEEEGPGAGELPTVVSAEDALVREVWTGATPKDIEMDSRKVDEVKEAMMNFTLPPANIPEWASSVPEEQWKEHILKRLERK